MHTPRLSPPPPPTYLIVNSRMICPSFVCTFQAAPKDKLLVFNLSSGWEPLCEFLGRPVPSVPFPHLNKDGRLFEDVVPNHPVTKQIEKELLAVLGISSLTALYILYHFMTNSHCTSRLYRFFVSGMDAVLNRFSYFRKIHL